MGWKGTVRSIRADLRAIERDSKRRQRELALRQKQYAKMQALEQAAYEVEVYNNHLDLIRSIHRDCGASLDWKSTVALHKPTEPTRRNMNEIKAREILNRYNPSFFDRIFKLENKKRKNHEESLDAAITLDNVTFRNALKVWQDNTLEWEENVALGQAILALNAKARLALIEKVDPFAEISGLGSRLQCKAEDHEPIHVTVKVHGSQIIPDEVKTLLQSGKLSSKKMAKGQFNELHQDYVCSLVLRIAREVFAILPDDMVIVTAVDDLLDKTTGHMVEMPILSVAFSRDTVSKLNLEKIDPSDSMENFVHRMSYKKTTGFDGIRALAYPLTA